MTLLCLPPCVPEASRVTLLPTPASALSYRDPAGGAPLSGLRPCLPPPESTKKAPGLKEATASRPQQARLMLPQAGQDPRLHSMFQGRAHQSQSVRLRARQWSLLRETPPSTSNLHAQHLLIFLPLTLHHKCFPFPR